MDGDGDLDVLLTQIGGPPRVLRNNLFDPANQSPARVHFLRFKLVGTRDNRDAIGAWVEVDLDGQTLRRQVMPARSYLAQVELPVTVGLGSHVQPQQVRVQWPNGNVQAVDRYVVDGLTTVRQGEAPLP